MRRAVAIALCAGIVLGVLVTRELLSGSESLERGDHALQRHRDSEAIWLWQAAARSYLPLAPHVGAAYDRLETLARSAEARGDTDLALAAWTAVRSSILATRSLWLPHGERLAPANRRIAALLGAQDPGPNPAERIAWHAARLAEVAAPHLLWTLVALAGGILWIGGATRFALRCGSNSAPCSLRTIALHGVAVGGGLLLWLFGLFLA